MFSLRQKQGRAFLSDPLGDVKAPRSMEIFANGRNSGIREALSRNTRAPLDEPTKREASTIDGIRRNVYLSLRDTPTERE